MRGFASACPPASDQTGSAGIRQTWYSWCGVWANTPEFERCSSAVSDCCVTSDLGLRTELRLGRRSQAALASRSMRWSLSGVMLVQRALRVRSQTFAHRTSNLPVEATPNNGPVGQANLLNKWVARCAHTGH
jgi:hypothetical protein